MSDKEPWLIGEGYMESKIDKVEVKECSADIVKKVMQFIYTAVYWPHADSIVDYAQRMVHRDAWITREALKRACSIDNWGVHVVIENAHAAYGSAQCMNADDP